MFLADEKQRSSARAMGILLAICCLCLVPFLQKAFHIDDPVYIWVAQHIHSNPLDFYGFSVNWLGKLEPMTFNENPPLVSYYIALVAYWFGWSEGALHAAFIVPACAVILGTYLLAKDLCDWPFIAALTTMCTPVFLISGTTIMCDVLMVSFWVFAVYFWRRGLKSDNKLLLAFAAVLISASSLAKYSGMNLIPLLFAYSLFEKKKAGMWMLFFLMPIACVGLYEWTTSVLYDAGHITSVGSLLLESKKLHIANVVTGISFLGGCILISLFYFLFFGSKLKLALSLSLISFTLLVLMRYDVLSSYPIVNADGINWIFVAQLPFFVLAGASFIFIVISDYLRNRDPDSLLLFLWVTGTFAFTLFIGWSVNGRSILPIAPVAGIMVVRHLRHSSKVNTHDRRWLYVPVALSLVIALMVTTADYRLANSARTFVYTVQDSLGNLPGNVWFEGHWGFQYYMQEAGGKALDYDKPSLKNGDLVIIPANNSNTKSLSNDFVTYIKGYKLDGASLLSTMDINTGAGFYSDVFGPLPYAIGHTPEKYYFYRVTDDKESAI